MPSPNLAPPTPCSGRARSAFTARATVSCSASTARARAHTPHAFTTIPTLCLYPLSLPCAHTPRAGHTTTRIPTVYLCPPDTTLSSHRHPRRSGTAAMYTTLILFALSSVAVAQVPKGPPVWQMNRSTLIMPCNGTGPTDPSSTKGWGTIDFDWSNWKGRDVGRPRATQPSPAPNPDCLTACLWL